MEEKLTIYQQYLLEEALFKISLSPYVMICSDDNEILNYCRNEMLKRIDYIKCVYDYPDAYDEFIIPEWLKEILMQYKSLMIMNFDEKIEKRIKSNPEVYNEEYMKNANVYRLPNFTVDEYAAWTELGYFREYLGGYSTSLNKVLSSVIVLCSNKFKKINATDLRDFMDIYCLDDAKRYCRHEDEETIKTYIKNLRQIDYNMRHKDNIKMYGGKNI